MDLWFKLREINLQVCATCWAPRKSFSNPNTFLYWTVPNIQNSNRVDKSVRHEGCPDRLKNNLKDDGYSGTQYNPSIQKVEAEESKIQSCPQLYNKFTMSLINEPVSNIYIYI